MPQFTRLHYFELLTCIYLVEKAEERPLEGLVECSECGAQNLKGVEVCAVCEHILISTICINEECGESIAKSAQVCPHCGKSQQPEVLTPWSCLVCHEKNDASLDVCKKCGSTRGALSPLSKEFLFQNSTKADRLSIQGCSIPLADGSYSLPINVNTYVTQSPITPHDNSVRIPLHVFKEDEISVFLDQSHPVFRTYQLRPEQMIAAEIALYVYDRHKSLSRLSGTHALSVLEWAILRDRWAEELEDSANRVKEDIHNFFDQLKDLLPALADGFVADFYNELTEMERRDLGTNILAQGTDIKQLSKMIESGEYLRYIDNSTVIRIVKMAPTLFFDGNFWSDTYSDGDTDLMGEIVQQAQERILGTYQNCMEDVARFEKYSEPNITITQRARASLQILVQKMV